MPVPIEAGLSWGFITQMNRAQRQLIILTKQIHEINYIEGLLLTLNTLSVDVNDSIIKVNTAINKLIDYQIKNGTDYLVVWGTTAETPTLSSDEKIAVQKFVVERVNRRIPIVLGVGGNSTADVVKRLKEDDLDGIDAILSVVPYYNKPSQEGIYQHYKAIALASKLPIVLYNVPGRTGVNMTAETTLRIAKEFKNVVAIKEASGNITQMDDIIKNKPASFMVISGDDGITFPLITLGAVGVISVIGNAFPKELSRMVGLALAGDFKNALQNNHGFPDLLNFFFFTVIPAGLKG